MSLNYCNSFYKLFSLLTAICILIDALSIFIHLSIYLQNTRPHCLPKAVVFEERVRVQYRGYSYEDKWAG